MAVGWGWDLGSGVHSGHMAKGLPIPCWVLPTFVHPRKEGSPKQPLLCGTVLPLTQHVSSAAEKQRSKKPGSSHLRAARRQGRTVLHRLSNQFARRDHGEMKINRVRTWGSLQLRLVPPGLGLQASWQCCSFPGISPTAKPGLTRMLFPCTHLTGLPRH